MGEETRPPRAFRHPGLYEATRRRPLSGQREEYAGIIYDTVEQNPIAKGEPAGEEAIAGPEDPFAPPGDRIRREEDAMCG